MNSQSKPAGFDGTATQVSTSHGYNFRSSSPSTSTSKSVILSKYILRSTAMVLAFIASIVMGTGKNRARVAIPDPTSSTMQPLIFVETIKAKYSSALLYFIVVNVLVFLYSASSLVVSAVNKGSSKNLDLAFKIADILFLVLLFSSNGSAIATSVAIENGNIHMGWIKICNAASEFCTQLTAAVVLSMFSSVAHVAKILLEMIGTHYRD